MIETSRKPKSESQNSVIGLFGLEKTFKTIETNRKPNTATKLCLGI